MTERDVAPMSELHQSVWRDNLSRGLVRPGALTRLRNQGVIRITRSR